jgi:hypothetical protein
LGGRAALDRLREGDDAKATEVRSFAVFLVAGEKGKTSACRLG